MQRKKTFNKLPIDVQTELQAINGATTEWLGLHNVSRKQIRAMWGIVFDSYRLVGKEGGKQQYIAAWRYSPEEFTLQRKKHRSNKDLSALDKVKPVDVPKDMTLSPDEFTAMLKVGKEAEDGEAQDTK